MVIKQSLATTRRQALFLEFGTPSHKCKSGCFKRLVGYRFLYLIVLQI